MPPPTWDLPEPKRQWLMGLLIMQGFLGLPYCVALLAITVYIRFAVDEELDLVQSMNTKDLPYLLAFGGTFNFLALVLHAVAMMRARPPSTRETSMTQVMVGNVVLAVASTILFAASIFAFVKMSYLESEFAAGLYQAMKSYSKDPSIKTRMDILQIEYQCCGDENYYDWFSVPWVLEKYLIVNARELQTSKQDEPYINDDVPFSCCDPGSERPCIHHHVHTPYLHYGYDHDKKHTLHKQGCREALMHYFGHTLLRGVGLFVLFQALAQFGVVVVTRLLQTSMQTAISSGDVTATAVGYLFGPPGEPGDKDKPKQGESSEGEALLTTETETAGETTEEDSIYDDLNPPDGGDSPDGERIYENLDDLDIDFAETTNQNRAIPGAERMAMRPSSAAFGYKAGDAEAMSRRNPPLTRFTEMEPAYANQDWQDVYPGSYADEHLYDRGTYMPPGPLDPLSEDEVHGSYDSP